MSAVDNIPMLIASSFLDDWFIIEPYSGTGQPEGMSNDIADILLGMSTRTCISRRRIAVEFDPGGNAHLWSPRNSLDHDAAIVPYDKIDAWVAQGRKILEAYASNKS